MYGPEGGAFSYEMPPRIRNHPRPIKPIQTNPLTYTLALAQQRKNTQWSVPFL